MITIKELAEEFNTTEYRIRRILRTNNIRRRTRYQWRWRQNTKGLEEVRTILKKAIYKS